MINWEVILWTCVTIGVLLGVFAMILSIISAVNMKKRRKDMADIHTTLAIGSKVMFAGGFSGKVVRMGEEAERSANQLVNGVKMQQLKSKTVSAAGIEATYEVRVDKPDALLNKLRNIPGVHDATLVAYQGEAV